VSRSLRLQSGNNSSGMGLKIFSMPQQMQQNQEY
jgi:hypothetical protein